MSQQKKVRLPAILITPGYVFYKIDSLDSVTNPRGWKDGSPYETDKLYDSEGVLWESISVPIPQWSIWEKLLNISRTLSMTPSKPRNTSVNEVAEMLCKIVDAEWDDDVLDQFVSRDKLKELFRNAKTPDELIYVSGNRGADLVEG